MDPLFPSLTCKKCGGSLTKVSEKDGVAKYVCMNDETHILTKRVKTKKGFVVKSHGDAEQGPRTAAAIPDNSQAPFTTAVAPHRIK